MMTSKVQESRSTEVGGVAFVGFLLLGFGIGFLIGNIPAGMFVGLGVGFIAMTVAIAGGKQESASRGGSGMAFVGCLLLGFGAGFLTGNVPAGMFVGLGAGFIAMGIVLMITGQW